MANEEYESGVEWARSPATNAALERLVAKQIRDKLEQEAKERRASIDDFCGWLGYPTNTPEGFESLRQDLAHARKMRLASEKTSGDVRRTLVTVIGVAVAGAFTWLGMTILAAIRGHG